MFTKLFVQAAVERALKTFAQSLLSLIGSNATGLFNVSTLHSVEASAIAAVLSVLSSLVSAQTNPTGSPSLVQAPPTGPGV